ncbi:MAG: hypothetical protein N838_31720 [Thiohalocapsa sp. PB-PSB1]|nr:MAG: hypothetical protein N838_31720 [Thiohalocapsa sp. PB-PSB1]
MSFDLYTIWRELVPTVGVDLRGDRLDTGAITGEKHTEAATRS